MCCTASCTKQRPPELSRGAVIILDICCSFALRPPATNLVLFRHERLPDKLSIDALDITRL